MFSKVATTKSIVETILFEKKNWNKFCLDFYLSTSFNFIMNIRVDHIV